MTTEYQNQENKNSQGSSFQTVTLVFAGATLIFALLAMGTGLRLSALQADRMNAMKQSNSLENETLLVLQTDLENARAELASTKKESEAAKQKASEQNHQVASLAKEVEKVKSELALANTTIESLKKAEQQTFKPVTAAPTTDDVPQNTSSSPEASPPASFNQKNTFFDGQPPNTPNQQQAQESFLESSSPTLNIEPRSESETAVTVATQPAEMSKSEKTTEPLTEESLTEEPFIQEGAVQTPAASTSQEVQ